MASPVFFQKPLAAARVVRLLLNLIERVVLAQRDKKRVDDQVEVRTPTVAIAVVAVDAHVEGIKVGTFISFGRFDQKIGSAHVLEKALRLGPLLSSAAQSPSIVMDSSARLDFTNGLSGVAASHGMGHVRQSQHLVALTRDQEFLLELQADGRSDPCQLQVLEVQTVQVRKHRFLEFVRGGKVMLKPRCAVLALLRAVSS